MWSPSPGGDDPSVGSTRSDSPPISEQVRIRRGVKVLASDGDRVLLVREARPDGTSFWTLPGGGLRPAEPPLSGLQREIGEELRCRVTIDDRITDCVYQHTSRADTVSLYAVFAGTLRGEIRPNRSEGILRHAWIEPPVPTGTLLPFRRLVNSWFDVE